eukprot:1148783-Pelagomonas_calceolata.AAC.6
MHETFPEMPSQSEPAFWLYLPSFQVTKNPPLQVLAAVLPQPTLKPPDKSKHHVLWQKGPELDDLPVVCMAIERED